MAGQNNAHECSAAMEPLAGLSTGEQFLAEICWRFQHNAWKIQRCLAQLSDDELDWRPNDASNSVATLIVHLCGSTEQWIAALADQRHERNRPAEFAPGTGVNRIDLLNLLARVTQFAHDTTARLDPARLNEMMVIQGFENSRLTALYGTERHQAEHIGQIVYITKLKRGVDFESLWAPANKEQASSPYLCGLDAAK